MPPSDGSSPIRGIRINIEVQAPNFRVNQAFPVQPNQAIGEDD